MRYFPLPVKKGRDEILADNAVVGCNDGSGLLCSLAVSGKSGIDAGSVSQIRWLAGLCVAVAGSLLFAVLTFYGARFAGRQSFRQVRAEMKGDDVPREENIAGSPF